VITANQIKYVKSLQQTKFRQKYNKFIAEGAKITKEILENSTYEIDHLFATANWIEEHNEKLVNKSVNFTEVNKREMGKISALKTASEVFVVMNTPEPREFNIQNKSIYLDDVQDPGNVGTIIRIADWFGIQQIIRSSGSADFYNPKVIQASMGSFLNVDLQNSNLTDLDVSNHKIIGTEMNGSSLKNFAWPENAVLVMGNEGRGMSPEIAKVVDLSISIPGSSAKIAESLNVGIATGIICHSWFL